MGIDEEEDDLAEIDNNNHSDFINYYSCNEARLNLEVMANVKEDDDELENKIDPKVEDKRIIVEHTSCCQIK